MIANATTYMTLARGGSSTLALRCASEISRWPWLMAAAAAVLAAGAAMSWAFSGYPQPLADFLGRLGAVSLTGFSAAEYVLALACWRLFERGEPLRRAWLFITLAAGSRAAGLIVANLTSGFGIDRSPVPGAAATQAAATGGLGMAVSNPLTMALLAAGLLVVLKACRDVGLLRRPSAIEMVLLLTVMLFLVGRFFAMTRSLMSSAGFAALVKGIGAIADPLLGLLLVAAVLLRRPVQEMGNGLIGRCWGAYIAAIFLTFVAGMGTWATNAGYLPWQYGFVNSVAGLLAALAFALAPAHQVEAIVRARYPWLRAS